MAPESKADQWSFPGVCGHSAILVTIFKTKRCPGDFLQNISPPVSFELSTSREVSSWEFRVSPQVTCPEWERGRRWRRSCRLENSPVTFPGWWWSAIAPVTCLLRIQLIVEHKRTSFYWEKTCFASLKYSRLPPFSLVACFSFLVSEIVLWVFIIILIHAKTWHRISVV